jgi:hypothetical protein
MKALFLLVAVTSVPGVPARADEPEAFAVHGPACFVAARLHAER